MKTIIYGNGAMARVLASYLKSKSDLVGFTVEDRFLQVGEVFFNGLPIVPFSQVERTFTPTVHRILIVVGFSEMNDVRKRVAEEAKKKGYELGSFIHESVIIHDDVKIGENTIILDQVAIHPGSTIGDNTFIASNVSIGHDCHICANNWINSGVSMGGYCKVGEGSFFGVNATLSDAVSIGKKCFIGANTLINKDTGDETVYISEAGQLFPMKSSRFLKFISK